MTEENKSEKILYILRGLPGSGKSSLAKSIINSHDKKGIVLSTDDYFIVNGEYQYDPTKIAEAHIFNQTRCRENCEKGVSPIIVDNTNVKCWEAKVYVEMALENGYEIRVREPETPWWKERNAEVLAKKTVHGVPVKKIKGMLRQWDDDFSVENILKSEPPNRDNHNRNDNNNNDNENNGNGRGRGRGRGNFHGNSRGGNFRGNFRGNGNNSYRGGNGRGRGNNRGNSRGNFRGNGRGISNYRGNNFRGGNHGSYYNNNNNNNNTNNNDN